MNAPWPPHPDNAPGDFYVEDGCCLTCGMAEAEAPEVFGRAKSDPGHCVVAKQPQTPENMDRTFRAVASAEADCIRYRGTDPEIARRLVEMGHGSLCDLPPPADAMPLARTHTRFEAVGGPSSLTARQLAQTFSDYFIGSRTHPIQDFKAKPVRALGRRAWVKISWFQNCFHSVKFDALPNGKWLAVTHPQMADAWIGLSWTLDNWLRSDGRFADIRWYSAEQWRAGGPFRRTVV
ncbi:MAG TPA: ferredoxin [Alphaproteobacteria bacterium]|jgi:hypothetical protein|nr:ferredoxin [Alphaproteobacteria bacterium]